MVRLFSKLLCWLVIAPVTLVVGIVAYPFVWLFRKRPIDPDWLFKREMRSRGLMKKTTPRYVESPSVRRIRDHHRR